MSRNLLPVRKIAVAGIAAGLAYLAMKLGLKFSEGDLNVAAEGLVTVAAGYLARP